MLDPTARTCKCTETRIIEMHMFFRCIIKGNRKKTKGKQIMGKKRNYEKTLLEKGKRMIRKIRRNEEQYSASFFMPVTVAELSNHDSVGMISD